MFMSEGRPISSTNGSAELGQSIGEGELAAGKAIEQATGAQDSYSQG